MDDWDYTDDALVLELDEGVKVEIKKEMEVDPDFHNPRKNDDGILGVMFTKHSDYIFGGAAQDESDWDADWEIYCERCKGEGVNSKGDECARCDGRCTRQVNPIKYFQVTENARVVLALTLYDHSGISMSAHDPDVHPAYPYDCPWDAGIVGFYFDTPSTRKKCGIEDWSDEQIKDSLIKEIEVYDSFLRGEIYYYNVEDADGEFMVGCGGFVGDVEYVKSEAKEAGKWAINEVIKEKTEREHWAARDMVTV